MTAEIACSVEFRMHEDVFTWKPECDLPQFARDATLRLGLVIEENRQQARRTL